MITHDARLRLAEVLSEVTGKTFEAVEGYANNVGYIKEVYDDEGHSFTLSDKEAIDRLVKENAVIAKRVAKAYALLILLYQDMD